jgi:Leucine-rich repeat (LRR) protein
MMSPPIFFSPFSINDCPPEILCEIFNDVIHSSERNKNLCSLRAVCKKWQTICDTIILLPDWQNFQARIKNPTLVTYVSAMNTTQFSIFHRFRKLAEMIERDGYPQENLPTGFNPEKYEKAQSEIDLSLEIMWRTTQQLHVTLSGPTNTSRAGTIRQSLSQTDYQVKIDAVQNLSLFKANLSILPSEIGQFTKLQTLNLSYNNLQCLPYAFKNLTALKTLQLAENNLKTIPQELNHLSHLTELDLTHAQLATLTLEFETLHNLQILSLYKNKLTNIPPQIGELPYLQCLGLSFNQLTVLPKELGNCTKLRTLDIEYNKLHDLPPTFSALSNLTWLNISNNDLKSLPNEFGALIQLEWVFLSSNSLTYLPQGITKLTKLAALDLRENLWNIAPSCLCFCSQWQHIVLSPDRL